MAYSSHPSLPYSAFRQACRAFKPTELVPALARASAAMGEPPYSNRVKTKMPPWGLAAAARESLLHGNEHRSKPVDGRAVAALMRQVGWIQPMNSSAITPAAIAARAKAAILMLLPTPAGAAGVGTSCAQLGLLKSAAQRL